MLRYAFMYHTNVTAAWKFLHNSSLCRCLKNGRAALYVRCQHPEIPYRSGLQQRGAARRILILARPGPGR
eukprot:COSAG01_NODE_1126_length_11588_cov_40.954652_8_plen_70_part_00